MLHHSKWHHRRRPEDGFTLIELAVVMLIIAILVVVSLAFFGLIGTAHTSVDIQDLKGVQIAAQDLWAQNGGTFTGITYAQLNAAEPGVQVTNPDTNPANPNSVNIYFYPGGNTALIEAYSPQPFGCIALLDIANQASHLYSAFGGTGVWWSANFISGAQIYWPATASNGGWACSADGSEQILTSSAGWSRTPAAIEAAG